MANKLIITESQFKRIKQRLMETPLSTLVSSEIQENDIIQITMGNDKVIFKVVEVYKGTEVTLLGLSNYVKDYLFVMKNVSLSGNELFVYKIQKDIEPKPAVEDWPGVRLKITNLELFRNGKIIDVADINGKRNFNPNSTLGDYTEEEPESNPNLIHIGPDEKSPEIHLGGSGKMPTGDEPAEEPETTPEENDEEEDDVDVAKKYYKEIMADPFLKQVFYKYPSTWDYIVAAAKGEKAKGGGLGPALELVDSYKNKRASELTPGFTNKEKKIANFKIKNSINIKFKTISGKSGKVVLNYWDTHEAVVQKYPTIGNSAITTLKNTVKNYKIDILETTEDPNIFVCDFSAYKKGVIEEDTYYSERVNVEFTQSPGYNYINKDNTTNTTTNR